MSASLEIDEILSSDSPGETRVALLSQGRLVELLLTRESGASRVGNIYLARVGKAVPGADAAFVELGEGRAGFLSQRDAKGLLDARGEALARPPSEGEAVLVQLVEDEYRGKGPSVASALALPGHRLVLMPTRPGLSVSRKIGDAEERKRLEALLAAELKAGEGVVLRTAAAGADAALLADELVRLRELWRKVMALAASAEAPKLLHAEADALERALRDHGGRALRRVVCDRRETLRRAAALMARGGSAGTIEPELHQGREALFAEREIEEQIAQALAREVPLPAGGSLVIEALEALVAIDVNTARGTAGAGAEAARLAVNLEAAAELARQARLRNLAGLIVVDFLHMEGAAPRARVAEALARAFADDPLGTQLAGFTSLGLFELTRRRGRAPLSEALGEPCDACRGEGRLPSAVTVAYEVLRAVERTARRAPSANLRVVAAEAVIAALEGEARAARRHLEGQLAAPLELSSGPGYRREQFDILTRAALGA